MLLIGTQYMTLGDYRDTRDSYVNETTELRGDNFREFIAIKNDDHKIFAPNSDTEQRKLDTIYNVKKDFLFSTAGEEDRNWKWDDVELYSDILDNENPDGQLLFK